MYNTSEILFYVIGSTAVAILLIGSAIISSAEVAIFSLSNKQIENCKKATDISSNRVITLLKDSESLLATMLIFNNLFNIAIFIFSSYMIWQYFGRENVTNIVTLLQTIISTTVIILFGEFIPKMYASQHNLYIARKVSKILSIFLVLGKPISYLLTKISGKFGKKLSKEKYALSPEKLNKALQLTKLTSLSNEENILNSILTLGSLYANQIMRPRTEIKCININADFHKLLKLINGSGYSRLPVYEKTIDNIKGTIYAKDLLPHINKDQDYQWNHLLKESFFIPESKRLDSLLFDFKTKRIHMAIVVDEYGGTSGLVTMEDIIKMIINIKYNDDSPMNIDDYHKLHNNVYIFDAKILISKFCSVLKIPQSDFHDIKGDSKSLAGLILELKGKIPNLNESISYKNYNFTILSVDNRKINKVKVEILG